MKIAVIGSRSFTNLEDIFSILDQYKIETIVSGGAKGVDSIAEKYASIHQIPTIIFKPDWNKYHKGAGFIRNKQIIDCADQVIAFWDMKSPGTHHSINMAKKTNKLLHVFTYIEGKLELVNEY